MPDGLVLPLSIILHFDLGIRSMYTLQSKSQEANRLLYKRPAPASQAPLPRLSELKNTLVFAAVEEKSKERIGVSSGS